MSHVREKVPGHMAILPFHDDLLSLVGIPTVSFSDWDRIDKMECGRGEKIGKPREKIVEVDEMIKLAK